MVKAHLTFAAFVVVSLTGLSGCAGQYESGTRDSWVSRYDSLDVARKGGHNDADPPIVNSLETLLQIAEVRNLGVRAAFDRWTAAAERVPQAASLPDPKLTYGYFLEPVETRVGPQRQRFGIQQTIPLFGKRGLRGEMAAMTAAAAGADFKQARLELRFKLTAMWNDYYYLKRAIELTEENQILAANMENVALAQYSAGRAPHASVIRAQLESDRLADRLQTLRDQRAPTVAALNAELDFPAASPIAWPDNLGNEPVLPDREELARELRANNPRLAERRAARERERVGARLADRAPIPDVTLGATIIETDESPFPNVRDSGKNAVTAQATVSLPLWFGKYEAQRAEAAARESASERELHQLENTLLAELEMVCFDLRDAERRTDLYALDLLPKARQSFEVTEDAFIAGDASFLDLVDAQRMLLEFELSHERARVDRATKNARLTLLTGRDSVVAMDVEDER